MRVGYYVHHHGRGHLHQARAVAAALKARGATVTGLSSLPRPDSWSGSWVDLPRDDTAETPRDADAGGRLHWVPRHDAGLRRRMARIASWLAESDPAVVVVDVSVEVCALVRLHGVPVVPVVLPGDRGDAPHRLAFDLAERLLGFWPATLAPAVGGLPEGVRSRVVPVGGLVPSRPVVKAPGRRRAVLLGGAGGTAISSVDVDRARATSGWEWTVVGPPGRWVRDVPARLADADVVVTHAGLGALSEVAAARRPAIVVPQERPHGEQVATAAALAAGGWPCHVVEGAWADQDWATLLDTVGRLDGDLWSAWGDPEAAERAAEVVLGVAS